jgi:hypothetical protein
MFLHVFSILVLVFEAVATYDGGVKCLDLFIPVEVNVPSYPPLIPPFANGYEAVAFLLEATKQDSNPDTSGLLGKGVILNTTFSIGATYCTPTHGKKSVVQLLSHGLGFDRSYWDLAGNLSYKDAAAASGYATLFYDRLGTGLSPTVDPYTISQVQIELAVLVELTTLLRAGKISPKIPPAAKVVHVGHSYGSVLSNAVAASAPELSDGAVMTGYSHNNTYQRWFQIATGWHLASENQPARFTNFSSGYLTWGGTQDSDYNKGFSLICQQTKILISTLS